MSWNSPLILFRLTLMFTVRVIENPSLVTRSVCVNMNQSVKREKRSCAGVKFAGGELYSVSDLEVIDFSETTFTVLLNVAKILLSLSDSTLKLLFQF